MLVQSIATDKWMQVIWFSVFILLLGLIFRLGYTALKRASRRTGISKPTLQAIQVIFRFIYSIIIVFSIINLLDVSSAILISLSSISGIILGFASTEVTSQIISGIYLMVAKPFTVYDLVQIGKTQGLVIEIGLNSTTLRKFDKSTVKIPNKALIDTKIINFSKKYPQLPITGIPQGSTPSNPDGGVKRSRKPLPSVAPTITVTPPTLPSAVSPFQKVRKSLIQVLEGVQNTFTEKHFTVFPFLTEFELTLNPERLLTQIQQVCDRFAPIFEVPPQFAIESIGWRVEIKIWLLANNPLLILDHRNAFVQALAESIYAQQEDPPHD